MPFIIIYHLSVIVYRKQCRENYIANHFTQMSIILLFLVFYNLTIINIFTYPFLMLMFPRNVKSSLFNQTNEPKKGNYFSSQRSHWKNL